MPKVTVLLFSYNHEKFIRACMDSVLAQTFRDFELIVIDDCSNDATWEIVQTYDDPRIQCIRTPRNTAAEWMYDGIDRFGTGEYIAVQNSDDLCRENCRPRSTIWTATRSAVRFSRGRR